MKNIKAPTPDEASIITNDLNALIENYMDKKNLGKLYAVNVVQVIQTSGNNVLEAHSMVNFSGDKLLKEVAIGLINITRQSIQSMEKKIYSRNPINDLMEWLESRSDKKNEGGPIFGKDPVCNNKNCGCDKNTRTEEDDEHLGFSMEVRRVVVENHAGGKYSATLDDFINKVESPIGWGKTKEEAIDSLQETIKLFRAN